MAGEAATVIVPVVKEQDNVRRLLERLSAGLGEHHAAVIFVDDSKDMRTEEAIHSAERQLNLPNLDIDVYHRMSDDCWGGLSGAVIDGFRLARTPYAIVMDGDLQHPPEVIRYILERLDAGNDLVVGSRYRDGGSRGGLDGPIRVAISVGCTKLTKTVFPRSVAGITDPMSGCFGIRLERLDLNRLKADGFKILLETLVTHPELKKAEVPLYFDKREKGTSKGNLAQGKKFLRQVTRLRLTYWWKSSPFSYFFCQRFLNFAFGGAGVAIIGALLLFGLVHVGVAPRVAFATQLAITLALNFTYNYLWTWRDRPHNQIGQRATWFLATRGATQLLSFGLFHMLVHTFGTTSQAALQAYNLACLAAVVPINYLTSDKLAFREKEHQLWGQLKRYMWWPIFATLYLGVLVGIIGLSRLSTLFMAGFFLSLAFFNLTISSLEAKWRLYSWNTPDTIDNMKWPEPVTDPEAHESFSIIIPAYDEEKVIAHTLLDHLQLRYQHYAIIVTLLLHDTPTIKEVLRVMQDHDPQERIRMVVSALQGREHDLLAVEHWLQTEVGAHRVTTAFIDTPRSNKPRQLNAALPECKGTYVTPMDAESSPRPDLLGSVVALFRREDADVVQGGVQLMNLGSGLKDWFKVHNVLEYFFWFSSRMFYQISAGFVPLGGNTVFIRRELLLQSGGWETDPRRGGLTEDCELGVRLSTQFGAKIVAAYDPALATREETPKTLTNREAGALVHQRVRWVQGFLSIFLRGDWLKLPTIRQRAIAGYILATPLLQAISGMLLPIAALTMTTSFMLGWPKPPMFVAMLLYAPLLPIAIILASQIQGLREFGREYQQKVRLRHYAYLVIGALPYQAVLMVAAVVAVKRHIQGKADWYKTGRANAHRETVVPATPEPALEGVPAA